MGKKKKTATFDILNFKEEIIADVNIANAEKFTSLKEEKVEIYEGAKGVQLLKIRNNLYPVRKFNDTPVYKVEQRHELQGAILIPIVLILWYLQTLYMFKLQNPDGNYFNPVTIITMLFLAGAIYYVVRTRTREMVNIINIVKNKKEWAVVNDDKTPSKTFRTIEYHSGFTFSHIVVGFTIGAVISYIIGLVMLRTSNLPLLNDSHASNGWVQFNSETGNKIVLKYIATVERLEMMSIYMIGGAVLLLLVNLAALIPASKKDTKKETVYMGDLVNYDPNTNKFQLVDYYIDRFENDQISVDTLEAATILYQKMQTRLKGEEIEIDEDIEFEFEDQELEKSITLELAREIIELNYKDLSNKDYSQMKVKDIIEKQREQNKQFFELANLIMNRSDLLEADRDAKQTLLDESIKQLDETTLLKEGLEIEKKSKKITPLELALSIVSGILFVGLFILIILLYNAGSGGI